jgi:hypothetical protein
MDGSLEPSAVTVSLQAADGVLDCLVVLRVDRPAVALSHISEHKVRWFQGLQLIYQGSSERSGF